MGSIDGLREQVEELKQRLNSPGVQLGADAEELKTRLASIKSNLEGKQQEIAKLTAEKQQLAAEKQRLAAEAQRAAAENGQLRTLLGEVMAVIDGQSADGPAKLLREFLDETDSLVKPATNGVKEAQPAEQSADLAASAPGRAEPARAGQQPQGAQGAGGSRPDPDVAIQLGTDVHDEAPEEEESPALRRILKRGRRAG